MFKFIDPREEQTDSTFRLKKSENNQSYELQWANVWVLITRNRANPTNVEILCSRKNLLPSADPLEVGNLSDSMAWALSRPESHSLSFSD